MKTLVFKKKKKRKRLAKPNSGGKFLPVTHEHAHSRFQSYILMNVVNSNNGIKNC